MFLEVLGEGQFRALEGSKPYIGKHLQTEKVAEYKVEMICEEKLIVEVVQELIKAHPYQEPAYEVYKVMTIENLLNEAR